MFGRATRREHGSVSGAVQREHGCYLVALRLDRQFEHTEIRITNASASAYTISLNESLKITAVDVGSATDPDVAVTTTRSTACKVSTAEDPVSVAQQAYSDDEISVEGYGVVNQVKTGIVDIAIDIIRLF